MKKLLVGLCLCTSFCIVFSSCSKSGSDTVASARDTTAASAAFVTGNWIVGSYTQKAEDKTSLFKGAVFTFSSGGKLTATQNSSVTEGTWSYSPSSLGYYGGAPTSASLVINLGAAKPGNSITKTWNVVSNNATSLSLVNPEPLENENLVFSKQ